MVKQYSVYLYGKKGDIYGTRKYPPLQDYYLFIKSNGGELLISSERMYLIIPSENKYIVEESRDFFGSDLSGMINKFLLGISPDVKLTDLRPQIGNLVMEATKEEILKRIEKEPID